jgi:glycine/D-amino acid oxidase-like deaminating enzyme
MSPDKSTGRMQRDFDTIVIGGGITGLCLSWFLADAGRAVVCLDDGRDAGSTANAGSLHVQMQSRLMRLFPERIADFEQTLPIYPRAVNFWQEIAADLGTDIELVTSGGLMVAEDASQLASLRAKSEREARNGVRTHILDQREVHDIAPYLGDAVIGASYCELEGKVNPLHANAAIEARACASGAHIQRPVTVTSVKRQGPVYLLETTRDSFVAASVVIAAGAGSGRLAGALGLRLPAQSEPLHMNITDPALPLVQHLVQHAERPITLKQFKAGNVVIGGGWPASQDVPGEPPGVLLDSVLGNLELAGHIVPAISSLRLLRTWAGINPMVDLLSVIGEVPTSAGLHVALPGDAGYTLGPYCARLLVDAMLGKSPDYSLAPFSPMRF